MIKKTLLGIGIAACIVTSCTRYDNPEPYFEEYEQGQEYAVRNKVLIITVDGLVGSQIREYTPATISQMMQYGKYSFTAMADLNTGEAPSMVTLLTGYPSSVHGVLTESYLPEPDPSDPHHGLAFSPSLIYRLERREQRINTAVIMRNGALTGNLLGDADLAAVETTDQGIKNRTVDHLNTGNPDVILVQFSDLKAAGMDGGFVVTNNKYKEALDQVDGYIGEIKDALEARDNHENENWLIVICSSHGGTASGSFGGVSSDEMETFSLYYNEMFLPVEMESDGMSSFFANGYFPGTYRHNSNQSAPWTMEPKVFTEIGVRAQSPAGTSSDMFNPAYTGEMTFEFKMKLREDNSIWAQLGYAFIGGYRNYWNYVLGKDPNANNNDAGWHVRGEDGSFSLRLQNGSATESLGFSRGTAGEWNHYAFTFRGVSNGTELAVYVNGFRAAGMRSSYPIETFRNSEPLTIGFNLQNTTLSNTNADMADVRVWNKELSAEQIENIACTKWIESDHPLVSNLVAYYTEFDGISWKNTINTSAPDMTLSGNHHDINVVQNYVPCASDESEVFVQNIDLLPQVFYWLEINPSEQWNLAGSVFLSRFENEFKR